MMIRLRDDAPKAVPRPEPGLPASWRLASAPAPRRRPRSPAPAALGGHRRNKIYGTLDCPGARYWLARGHYVKQRVFFADEETAIAAGYRPCARCMPEAYAEWKAKPAER